MHILAGTKLITQIKNIILLPLSILLFIVINQIYKDKSPPVRHPTV